MKQKNRTIYISTIFFIELLILTVQVAGWQEFQVYPSDDVQSQPDIYGAIVVWEQFVQGDYDIYGAQLTDANVPSVFIVAQFPADQLEPAVYQNIVVWQDFVETDWDIYGSDIAEVNSLFEVSIVLDNDEISPKIHGDIVVWQDGDMGSYNI